MYVELDGGKRSIREIWNKGLKYLGLGQLQKARDIGFGLKIIFFKKTFIMSYKNYKLG